MSSLGKKLGPEEQKVHFGPNRMGIIRRKLGPERRKWKIGHKWMGK